MSGYATFVDGAKHFEMSDGLVLTDARVDFPGMSAERYTIDDVWAKIDSVTQELSDVSFVRPGTRRDGENWTPQFFIEYTEWQKAGRSHSQFNRAIATLGKRHRDFQKFESA